jgi:predicted metal-dependent phosphoesterase TrpH
LLAASVVAIGGWRRKRRYRAADRACTLDRLGERLNVIIDLHVHTRVGSNDSRIDEAELGRLGQRVPELTGIVLTEHQQRWPEIAFSALRSRMFAVNAREVETRFGHILVIGVPDDAIARAKGTPELRDATLQHGGLMILAHPFRHYPSSWNLLFPQSQDHWKAKELAEWPPERLAEHPVFALVDALETLNGGCLGTQNRLAQSVADALALPAVGASDAHDLNHIGYYATEFEDVIASEEELIAAVRAGRCRPVERDRRAGHFAASPLLAP